VEARDAFQLPAGSRLFNTVYPLHAASIGGLPYKLAMTFAGLGLSLLGSLAVWTFWSGHPRRFCAGSNGPFLSLGFRMRR
jgi:uncharacterized iron-regulated membrane protein